MKFAIKWSPDMSVPSPRRSDFYNAKLINNAILYQYEQTTRVPTENNSN